MSTSTPVIKVPDGAHAQAQQPQQEGRDARDTLTPPSAIDPLSHHIFVRTNTDRSIPSRLRNSTVRPDSPAANETLPRPSSDLSSKQTTAQQADSTREKKKGAASFLSRISMIGNKKKDHEINDDDSEISELRTDGANAIAFSSAVGAAGYIPHHKEPPRYIRVKAHHKKVKEFNRMFLAQELAGTRPPTSNNQDNDEVKTAIDGAPVKPVHGFGRKPINTGGPIWAVEFSKDGKYLATGGRDRVVRIWAVIATPEDRAAYEEQSTTHEGHAERLSAPVFLPKPVREFTGHTGEILDLSWSKNNFLLSSSMDKTVRLWHMSRQESIFTFKHKDFVTSIAFHPRDDRFFLSGCLDSTLRLWSIPDKSVAFSSQLSDLLTAVAFSPDGKTAIAGCLNGLCTFYEAEGLKFQTQIHVRSSRGKNAKGNKITGIETMRFPPNAPDEKGDVRVLVTSNDSRIRIYSLSDKSLEVKFKGHLNACNQIRASFSDDGRYIVCGSEDRKAFIWSTGPEQPENRDKRPCESFEAHPTVVTQAVLAPRTTRHLLQTSLDPIYTLCNPPPVLLVSRDEVTASHVTLEETQETQAEGQTPPKAKKPEQTLSPAFLARAEHRDGNILVTTDHSGIIKVFRQDCAFMKRRRDNWETGSAFSRKMEKDGLLGRTGSIVTRTSASSMRDPHSRRGSITQAPNIVTPNMSSERIISWRQGIERTPEKGRPSSLIMSTPSRSERSISPAKARTPASSNLASASASEARRQPYANAHPTSPTSSAKKGDAGERERLERLQPQSPAVPPTPSFSFISKDDELDVGGISPDTANTSFSFWNLNRWRGMTGGAKLSGSSSASLSLSKEKEKKTTSESPSPSPLAQDGLKVTKEKEKEKDKDKDKGRKKSIPGIPLMDKSDLDVGSNAKAAASGASGEKENQQPVSSSGRRKSSSATTIRKLRGNNSTQHASSTPPPPPPATASTTVT